MGMKFFSLPSHRVFHYVPMYYDEEKERLERSVKAAEREAKGEYVPGEIIRKGFSRMKPSVRKSKGGYTAAKRYLVYFLLIAILVALFYFSKAFSSLIAAYKMSQG